MALLNDDAGLIARLPALAEGLRARSWRLTTAESCTGGLVAALCTSVAGSSDWFERGFVTYSNAAKTELLGVDRVSILRFRHLLEEHNLSPKILEVINAKLAAHGLLLKTGTVVDATLIAAHGAVSEPVVRAMAQGALAHSAADLAIAVTGIAGPTGATPGKPVGLVWLGLAWRGETRAEQRVFAGDRTAVRSATVQWGLDRLLEVLATTPR